MRIGDGEKQGRPRSISGWGSGLISKEAKDHQELASLALSPGVGIGDSQTTMPIFREIKKVGGHPWEPDWKCSCCEIIRCPFQKSEDCSLRSQRLANTLCPSGGMLKPSAFEGSNGCIWAQDHPALTPWGCWGWPVSTPWVLWGLRSPDHRGREGAAQTLHWTTGGLAGGLQSFIRYMLCKHLVPFWMVDYFIPCSFYTQLFFILRKSNSSILSFVACAFGSRSKKTEPNPRSWWFTLMFSSMSFIILVLTSRLLIHFVLILYTGSGREGSNFILLCVGIQLSQHLC